MKQDEKMNLGNVMGTFKPEFIEKVLQTSKTAREIDVNDPEAKEKLQESRKEILALREDIAKVAKFINQDVPILTGKIIAIKKYEAEHQHDISIFDYMGENVSKMLETDTTE